MVSNAKRMKYVSDNENEFSSSEIDSGDDFDPKEVSLRRLRNGKRLINNLQCGTNKPTRRPTRTPKSFSRNALIARENRLKKKLYMEKLEKEVSALKMDNKKLNTIVDNQSMLIGDLKKQVKYLKSVISNSPDISKLLCNIQNTGMSVRTSLDNNLPLKNDLIPKRNQYVAKKVPYSWNDEPKTFINSSPDTDVDINFDIPLDLPTDFPDFNLLDDLNQQEPYKSPLEEHDYTYSSDLMEKSMESNDEDVGVCLHVSKHHVSLEFCATCSENATNSWSN